MHSSKSVKALGAAGCLAVFLAILWLLDLLLYPCTYVRNDIHTLTTENIDVLVLGTSNARMGIDPDTMLEGTGLKGHNMANGGEYMVDAFYLLQLAESRHHLTSVILDVDPGYLVSEKETGNNYLLFYHEFPFSALKMRYFGAVMLPDDFRSMLFPSYEYALKDMLPRMGGNAMRKLSGDYQTDAFQTANMTYHENGFIGRTPVEEEAFPGWNPVLFEKNKIVQTNIDYLGRIIDFCRDHNIDLTASCLPQPDRALATYPESDQAAWNYLKSYFDENNTRFINFNDDAYDCFPHDVSKFVDYDGHMNRDSAETFSGVLGRMLFTQIKVDKPVSRGRK